MLQTGATEGATHVATARWCGHSLAMLSAADISVSCADGSRVGARQGVRAGLSWCLRRACARQGACPPPCPALCTISCRAHYRNSCNPLPVPAQAAKKNLLKASALGWAFSAGMHAWNASDAGGGVQKRDVAAVNALVASALAGLCIWRGLKEEED